MSFKVVVDFDLCQGHGVCEGEAPEVFELDEEGYLQILQDDVPETERANVEKAVKHCPQRAIRIEPT